MLRNLEFFVLHRVDDLIIHLWSIIELGHLDAAAAHELYLNMIVYTHGLAVVIAAGADIPLDELAERMYIAFCAFAIAVGGHPAPRPCDEPPGGLP